jgi:hypothetical protein
MNAIELMERFRGEGIDRYFGLSREAPPIEGFVLENVGGKWWVHFFERGDYTPVACFEDEYDACGFLYWKLHDNLSMVGPRAPEKPS